LTDKPNYYAVIPAVVRYSKQLSPQAKLIYAEITALSNHKGYCFASNKYFAELFDMELRSVSRLVAQLVKYKFIDTELIRYQKRKIILKLNHKGYRQNCLP